MAFIAEQLRQLGMVAIIMACAAGGTVGMLKLIRRFTKGKGFPEDPTAKEPDEKGKTGKED